MLKPSDPDLLTADQFIDGIFDLPEGGRWMELRAGRLHTFEPPDDRHGNVVRNLSRLLAEFAQTQPRGYACFELGLILHSDPGTVYFPPICYFTSGERFAETDQVATRRVPALVVEIASTNDRRRDMSDRVRAYLEWQVPTVWLIDPVAREVHLFRSGAAPRNYRDDQILLGDDELRDFQTPVAPLFNDPDWWTSAVKSRPSQQ